MAACWVLLKIGNMEVIKKNFSTDMWRMQDTGGAGLPTVGLNLHLKWLPKTASVATAL